MIKQHAQPWTAVRVRLGSNPSRTCAASATVVAALKSREAAALAIQAGMERGLGALGGLQALVAINGNHDDLDDLPF